MLLALKMENRGHKPENTGNHRNWIGKEADEPWRLQKERRSANALILVCKANFGLPISRIVR